MRKVLPERSAVQTLDVVEVMMVLSHANTTRTAHGASVTLKTSVESLFWDAVKVGSLLRDMNAAVLVVGTSLDGTVQHTDPNTETTASAQTECQASGSNQADGTSVSVAASAASTHGSRLIWIQVKFLWASSSLCSPVPADEGTA